MPTVRLKLSNYKEAIFNKRLVEIIDNVTSAYPFTFVNLERFRKEIEGLDELFWIKDEEGKYLLVNSKFASSLHFTASQIEGKPVDKFIPGYLLSFNKALDEYIKESRNAFIIEGFPFTGVSAGEDYQTIEIPVTNPEGNVAAIIGIAQKIDLISDKVKDLPSVLNLVKSLSKDFVYVDKKGIITEISDGFCSRFELISSELKGKHYNKTLPAKVKILIESFIESGKESYTVAVSDTDITESQAFFHFIRIDGSGIIILLESKIISEELKPANNTKTYDFLVQNNPEPVFVYDKANLRFLEVNSAALKLYGYARDEFLQLDLTDLYAPDDIQTLLDKNNEEFGKVYVTKPYRQKRKDGTTIFVELSRVKIKYYSKDALFNVIRNVTDKLKLEKESQQYSALYKNTSDLFFITDKDGFIKSVNSSTTETLGYSLESLQGSSFTSLVINEDRGKINTSVFKSLSKEKLSFITSLKKAGNEFLEVQLISNPVFDYKGEVDSYTVVCIVKQEKVKEVIKEVIKEVPVEISAASEDFSKVAPEAAFLSGIFHDLLTPINVILGFVQELTENIEQSTPEQREAVEIINQNRANLLSSMNSIIELTQIAKKQVEIKYSTSKIIDVIEKLRKDLLENKTIENVELEYGKISMSLEIKTDLQKFQKLFSLIVAITAKVSGRKKIYLSASPFTKELFVVYVRDEYSSLSEEFTEKLNAIFANGKRFSGRELGISLLTLNLCNSLMHLLGGEFKVFGEQEAGFVFPLDLTKIVESPKVEIETDDDVSKEKEEELQPEINEEKVKHVTKFEEVTFLKEPDIKEEDQPVQQTIDISGLSCLYLEDQPDSQMLFSVEMKDLKEINFAAGFEQALPLLKSKRFDFIVIDINLQGDYNGLDILRIIRTMPGYENIPIIAVTAYLLRGDVDKFIHAGFTDFVSKPIFKEKLLRSLKKVLFTV